jgi:hypothetical protein
MAPGLFASCASSAVRVKSPIEPLRLYSSDSYSASVLTLPGT